MERAFIRKGNGYQSCTAFDGLTVIASPLGGFDNASRESRVFRRASGGATCYGSHAIALATDDFGRGLYILMHNGSGREVLRVPDFFDGGDLVEHIKAMPERLQYALLYSIWNTASNARHEAQSQTAQEWAQAYQDGRIRKRRRGGRVSVYIETPFERDLRTGKANPGRVSINTATGEVAPA